jgi:hypothetical protein
MGEVDRSTLHPSAQVPEREFDELSGLLSSDQAGADGRSTGEADHREPHNLGAVIAVTDLDLDLAFRVPKGDDALVHDHLLLPATRTKGERRGAVGGRLGDRLRPAKL